MHIERVADKFCRSKFWRDSNSMENGRAAWQRITVALIADGLKPMDKSVLDIFATIGIFQDGVVKESVNGKPTTAHIFEVGLIAGFCADTTVHDAAFRRPEAQSGRASSWRLR